MGADLLLLTQQQGQQACLLPPRHEEACVGEETPPGKACQKVVPPNEAINEVIID